VRLVEKCVSKMKKKVVRLTEQDLENLVKNILGKSRKSKRLIKKIEDLQGTKRDQRVDRVIHSNEELNNMTSDELVRLFSDMSHPRGRWW